MSSRPNKWLKSFASLTRDVRKQSLQTSLSQTLGGINVLDSVQNMEVGLASTHSAFIPQLQRRSKACRVVRAGYRPFAAQARAQMPCKSAFLLYQFALKSSQRLSHRAVIINALARGSMPNNVLNTAHFVRWTAKSCAFVCPLANR